MPPSTVVPTPPNSDLRLRIAKRSEEEKEKNMVNSSVNWKAAIDELMKGRDLAVQLGTILEDSLPCYTNKELLVEISDSFSRALIALSSGVKLEADQNDQKNQKNEKIFGEKKRKIRSGRGGYRQRTQACTRTTARTLEDGHSWRKYGQKAIFNCKFPRGYYRCSHKHDQKCLATRQVQQSEQDPSLYVITYIGEHTCQDLHETLASLENEPCIIDFGSNVTTPTGQEHKSTFLATRKEYYDEEVVSNAFTPGTSSLTMVPELDTLQGSAQLVEELMGAVSEHGDVTSCLQPDSVDSLGWDFMECFEFSDMYDVDQGGASF